MIRVTCYYIIIISLNIKLIKFLTRFFAIVPEKYGGAENKANQMNVNRIFISFILVFVIICLLLLDSICPKVITLSGAYCIAMFINENVGQN
jgi:hypothetical protein